MSWGEGVKALLFWGPGVVIAALIIWVLYKIAMRLVSGFMALGAEFINAQKAQAESLAKMAQGTEGLRESIDGFVTRDNKDHREMMILLKCVIGKLDDMERKNGS